MIYAKNVQIFPFLLMQEQPVLTGHNSNFDRFFKKLPSMVLFIAKYAFIPTYTGVLCRNLCENLDFCPENAVRLQPF